MSNTKKLGMFKVTREDKLEKIRTRAETEDEMLKRANDIINGYR
jgi:hypothetical protein